MNQELTEANKPEFCSNTAIDKSYPELKTILEI